MVTTLKDNIEAVHNQLVAKKDEISATTTVL